MSGSAESKPTRDGSLTLRTISTGVSKPRSLGCVRRERRAPIVFLLVARFPTTDSKIEDCHDGWQTGRFGSSEIGIPPGVCGEREEHALLRGREQASCSYMFTV